MNKKNETNLRHIQARAKQHETKVNEILDGYSGLIKKTKIEGGVRKDEEKYIKENTEKHTEATRRLLAAEASAFAREVRNDAKELKEELIANISHPISAAVFSQLTTMRTFGIKPSRLQIENMLDLNGGNLLGLQAIDAVLTETGSQYTLQYFDVADYEADLAVLEHLAENADHFVPLDHHAAGCNVYRGENQTLKRADGQEVKTGFVWDSIALIQRNAAISSDLEKISGMVQRWSADVSTEIMNKASAAVKAEAAEQAKLEGKPVPNDPDPESTVTITDGSENGTALAREIGQETAREYSAVQALRDSHFVR